MTTRQEIILKRLHEEGLKTAAYFRTLSDGDFNQQVYSTGPLWRVRDLLAHFVSAPEDFVIDEFNATQVGSFKNASTEELLRLFESARAQTIDVVRGMDDNDFDRIGRHPWFGKVALEQMLKLIYRHNMIHERDIRKALETGQPVAHVDAKPPAADQ
jgi:hypothetical protein